MSANVTKTINGTQPWSCSYIPTTTAAKIGLTFAYCLILAVSLTGNIFIGIIVYKTKTMRNHINILIVNMAMSDLLFSIFLIPAGKLTTLNDQALCKLIPFLRGVSMSVSIYSLVLIAVDRFKAVVFPLRSPLISSKPRLFRILATWIVAMVTWSPNLIANKLRKSGERPVCVDLLTSASSSYKIYAVIVNVVGIYAFLLLVAILYAIIYYKVKSQTFLREQSANARQEHVKREQTVLKISIVIVLGLAVCWLPFSIVSILSQFDGGIRSRGFLAFTNFARFMVCANCAINPCILFLFSKNYRQGLRKILRCFSARSRGN